MHGWMEEGNEKKECYTTKNILLKIHSKGYSKMLIHDHDPRTK